MKMPQWFLFKELTKDSVTRSPVMAKPNGSVRGILFLFIPSHPTRDSAGADNSGWGSSKRLLKQPRERGSRLMAVQLGMPSPGTQRCPAHGFPLLVKDQSHTLATPDCRLTAGSTGIAGLALQGEGSWPPLGTQPRWLQLTPSPDPWSLPDWMRSVW